MSKNIYNLGVLDLEDDDVFKVIIWCVLLIGLYKICKERYIKIVGYYMDLVLERWLLINWEMRFWWVC